MAIWAFRRIAAGDQLLCCGIVDDNRLTIIMTPGSIRTGNSLGGSQPGVRYVYSQDDLAVRGVRNDFHFKLGLRGLAVLSSSPLTCGSILAIFKMNLKHLSSRASIGQARSASHRTNPF